MNTELPIVALVGASGAGKSTIAKMLVKYHGYGMLRGITTRARRPLEEHDEYEQFSLSYDDFLARRDRRELAEWAQHGMHWYGLPHTSFGFEWPLVSPMNAHGVEVLSQSKHAARLFVVGVRGDPGAPWFRRSAERRLRDPEMDRRGFPVLHKSNTFDLMVGNQGSPGDVRSLAEDIATRARMEIEQRVAR